MSYLILFCIIFSFAFVKCDNNSKRNLIIDLLLSENIRYNTTTIFNCWDKSETLNLSQWVFMQNYHVSIKNVNVDLIKTELNKTASIFVLDIDCDNAKDFLYQVGKLNLFIPKYRWFLLTDEITDEIVQNQFFQEVYMPVNSYVLLVQNFNNSEYIIEDIYKLAMSDSLIKKYITRWDVKGGFPFEDENAILPALRNDLLGTVLKIGIVILDNDTLNHLWDYRDKHVDTMSKLNFILFNYLSDYLNATKEFIFTDSWGYIHGNRTEYDGMIGLILSGAIEVGGTPLFMSHPRLKVIDFVSTTTPTGFKFLFRQPPLSSVSNIFTLPFTSAVWICLLALLAVTVVVFYTISLWERSQTSQQQIIDDSNEMTDNNVLLDVVLLIVSAICQQGASYELRSGKGKFISFLLFLSLMFVYVSYSAYIVALLQSKSNNIQTLKDLLVSDMKLGVEETPYSHFHFETATEPIRRAIYLTKIVPGQKSNFIPFEEGIGKLMKDQFAFHSEGTRIYKYINDRYFDNEKCGLKTIQYFPVGKIYSPLRKYSIYKDLFRFGINKLQEFGIQSREIQRLYAKKPSCSGQGNHFVSVGLIDIQPAFVLLGMGVVASVILLVLEKSVHIYSNKRLQTKVVKY